MKFEYNNDESGFFDENPNILKKLIIFIIVFLLGCITVYIVTIPFSALDLITGEGIEILIPIGGFFGIVLTFLSSQLKRVEETNKKLAQKNDEIIKQNEELKALILEINDKIEN